MMQSPHGSPRRWKVLNEPSANVSETVRQDTPTRWKGLQEPMLKRPRAARNENPELSALEYKALCVPSSSGYVIPQRRSDNNETSGIRGDDENETPLKKPRVETQETAPEKAATTQEPVGPQPPEFDLPENKNDLSSDTKLSSESKASVREQEPSPSVGKKVVDEVEPVEEDKATGTPRNETEAEAFVTEHEATRSAQKDGINVPDDYNALTLEALKTICRENGIEIPSGGKKHNIIAELSARDPIPSTFLGSVPLEYFTNQVLKDKCSSLGLTTSGKKESIIKRLDEAIRAT